MPRGHNFSRDEKLIIFSVIRFAERGKGSCLILLYHVNDCFQKRAPPLRTDSCSSGTDFAEIFSQSVACANLISCKILIYKIFVLTSYWKLSPQNGGPRKVLISQIVREAKACSVFK